MWMFSRLNILQRTFLLILIAAVLILATAFGSLQYAYSIYDKQLYDKSHRLLNLSSTVIDRELQKLEALSLGILSDSQVQAGLKQLWEGSSDYAGYQIRKQLTERLFKQISSSERYVQSVQVIDATGKVSRYGASPSFTEAKYASVIEASEEGRGGVRWFYPDEGDSTLMLVRQIRAYEPMTLKRIGVLILRVNMERLIEDYAGFASTDSDIIVQTGGRVLFPYQGEGAAASPHALADDGYRIVKKGGETVFLSYKKSAYMGWTYINSVPYEGIFQKIIHLKNTLLAVFALLLVLLLVIGRGFAKSLTRPIRSLISQMKEVQLGQLEQIDVAASAPPSQQLDEIGQLHRTFRLMIARINTLIRENYANQILLKETEFKALQAQINPHFLYNALDSIHWLAQKNAQPQISSMVLSLGYLLRASISNKKKVITLEEELATVRHYATIQKHRFRDRFDFAVDIPERVMKVRLPKLTLQPLIENAILYALEPFVEPCRIRVYLDRERPDGLEIVVEDSGPGIDPERLQKIWAGEVETRGTGIGLLNIKDRLRLAFGDAGGIEVESVRSGGTRVRVRLPLPEEDPS
ncbi:sensor histidine kinase [Paenibacillus sp. FSL W8-1187]|uniref:cache domain-containing sensor histidine kinase n=1 Tax=Paenibacillus sp. FSL W8-1187 TaxID=2975339 RepID=UPI0030DD1A62